MSLRSHRTIPVHARIKKLFVKVTDIVISVISKNYSWKRLNVEAKKKHYLIIELWIHCTPYIYTSRSTIVKDTDRFTSAARILGETWSSSSDARKINFFLFGVKSVNYDINCTLFREVQTFIIKTNRFSMATVWLFNYTFLVALISCCNFVCCLYLFDLCVSPISV